MRSTTAIAFCWENFGPTHVDRCEAVATHLPGVTVIGLEYQAKSTVYDWQAEEGRHFRKITSPFRAGPANLLLSIWLVRKVVGARARHVFLCHYHELTTQVAAILMRLFGLKVYLMIDSKFDDAPRRIWREAWKALWLQPYGGALVGSERTRSYLRFLGFRRRPVEVGYDSIALDRIRSLAGSPPAPAGLPHAERDVTVVARLVEKKNLFVTIEGFALYAKAAVRPRQLRIFGNGPLEAQLRAHAERLGVAHLVTFEGFRQTADVCRALAAALVLLLVSTEEQFGFAIVEALAMGVPVIVSDRCGARDDLVRSGVNGFVIEPDNPAAIAFFLTRLDGDEPLWRDMAGAAARAADRADVGVFARAVERLVGCAA